MTFTFLTDLPVSDSCQTMHSYCDRSRWRLSKMTANMAPQQLRYSTRKPPDWTNWQGWHKTRNISETVKVTNKTAGIKFVEIWTLNRTTSIYRVFHEKKLEKNHFKLTESVWFNRLLLVFFCGLNFINNFKHQLLLVVRQLLKNDKNAIIYSTVKIQCTLDY